MEKTDIKSLEFCKLQQYMTDCGEKKFHANQIYEWLHKKQAAGFDEMTNLSKQLRETLKEKTVLTNLVLEREQISKLDGTRKYLFQLADQNMVESVFMKYHHGNSVCISSQAGCRMGCRFCASTIDGLVRNLTPAEMLDQIYQIQRLTGERVSNVVVMGTGEPLDNYENLVTFLHMLTDEHGLHISQRNVTVSTCGLVPQIYRLAKEHLQITLALSLHASTQEKREELMPVAKSYGLQEVLQACRDYFEETGRRVSFEYSLIHGENDSPEDASRLAELLKGMNCHLNLIPVNPIRERSFTQPDKEHVQQFKHRMEKYGINVTVRREMGRDIDGACGQLRRKVIVQSQA
jgi:23S rRNA (adenine2503-C2)-methyltransferase